MLPILPQTSPQLVVLPLLLSSSCFRLGLDELHEGIAGTDGDLDGDVATQLDTDVDTQLDGDRDGGSDAGSNWAPVVSATSLSDYDGFSFVELEVDWDRSLAYLGSREPGVCFVVVDFSDELSPLVLDSFNDTSTPPTGGNTCLGLLAYENWSRLIISAQEGTIHVWDLGSNPNALSFTELSQVEISRPKRLSLNSGPPTSLYVARDWANGGAARLELSAGGILSNPMPYLSGGHNNDVVTTGDFVVTACWDNDCPIDILDASTMSVTESLDMTRGDRSGFWSGAISSDRTRVFMGGWISAFLVASPENLILTHWFDNDSVVRSAEFVDDGPRVLLYGVLPRGVGIEVWDVTDMSNPETIARSDIGSSHEPYSIEVDLARRRAIVVDNGGVFYVIDIDQIEPTSHSWPTF